MPDPNAGSPLRAGAVQFSNATSNLFLGTAPRSWMVSGVGGANQGTAQPQPARRYSNTTPKRPRPRRLNTVIPTPPPGGGHPTVVAATQSCSSRASPNLTRESRLETDTAEVAKDVRQQATLHPPGTPYMTANEPTNHAHQGQPVPTSSSMGADRPPVGGGAEIDDPSRVLVPVQFSGTNLDTTPGTRAEDNFPAEILTLGGDPTARLFTSPSQGSILPPHLPATDASPEENGLFILRSPRGASRTDKAAPLNPSIGHHFTAVGATPPADADNPDSRGKRVAGTTLSEERRTRARLSADNLDQQLPTPQDSPITSNMATLSEQFESALAAVAPHPPTIDPRLVIDSRRIEMMRDACRLNDSFFLLVHNLYCLWSAARKDILEQLHFTDMHFQGMRNLVQILGPNQHLTAGVFQLFLTFPRPPEALPQDKSREFVSLVEDVRCFLYHLTFGFATLREAALKRNCPPCPAEFKYCLKLPSPALQKALFLSILRRTFSDQAWLRQALSLFSTEMDNPAGSAISIAELNAYHGKQLDEIVSRWSQVYARQLMGYQARRNAGMPIPPASAQQSVDVAQTYHSNGLVSGSLDAQVNVHGLPHPPRSQSSAPAQHISRPSDPPFQPDQFIPSSSSPIQFSASPSHPPNPLSTQPESYSTTLRSHPLATPWTSGLGNVSSNFLGPPQTTSSNPHSQVRSTNWNGNNPGQALPNHYSQVSPGTLATVPTGAMRLPPSGGRAPEPDWEKFTIVGERQRGGRTEYCIRRNGSNISNDSWLPETQLQNAQGQIAAFRARIAANTHFIRQHDRGILSPGGPATQIRQHITSVNSMPSTFIQQQRGHASQLVSNLVAQQDPASRQDAPSVRRQQYPATAQSPQAPSLQQHPAYHTPANTDGSPWSAAMQLPPNAQHFSNPPTPTRASAPARPNPTPASASAQPQPTTGREPAVNGAYQMTPPTLPAARLPQSAILHHGQPQQRAVPQQGLPFFHPDPDFVLAQMAVPNPDFFALHQAGLRSPEYHKVVDLEGNESDARYYQYVEDIIELPQLITRDSDLVRWNVHIPHQLWLRRASPLAPFGEFLIPQRKVANGSVEFRLKAVIFAEKRGRTKPTLSEFCTQPTKWPKCLSVSINERHAVDFRRKAHYGIDLATDITEMVREGDNEIVVGAIFSPQEAELKFLMAVEIICIAEYQRLLKMPTRIAAADALAAITNSLKNNGEDDDDLVIERAMSIDLVDPFTSVIWVTPVRGSECRHRECFDLEVFLSSRVKDGGLSSPDKWHCPICKSDCRPPMLVIDEFLLGVRKTLEENDQLLAKVKAILVRDDGTWEPRLEASKDEGRDTPSSNTSDAGTPAPPAPAATEPTVAHSARSASTTSRTIDTRTIIVLDDDDSD
ncbi:hypothetical protein PV04_05558 [Phialophora macrospora]|uniref:SP-RING-type domain-containing protein n=1 Tax=Phialophora macrospora TaxID=1851006 RepID=A0A0D2CWZ6_9EURO|nr:hypothetical protein PV04_05558 [Phialophora macrospora]